MPFTRFGSWAPGPISDTFAYRSSGVSTRRGGVIENVRTGRDTNTQALRGQLLFGPYDSFQTRLIADVSAFQAYCCVEV